MPTHHELKQLPDGKVEVKLETGEIFTGDPLEVTAKLADSKVETRRHYEAKEVELLTRQQQLDTQQQTSTQQQPQSQEAQWQAYILDQTAKGLGYPNAEAYKADLAKVKGVTAEVENQVIAANFMNACPDFPNTPEAIAAISKRLEDNKWDYTPQSMIAAHSMLLRENAQDPTKGYKPLTPEEQNASWEQGLRASNRQPPPMLRSGSPESNPGGFDPWTVKDSDAVRKEYLTQLKAQK